MSKTKANTFHTFRLPDSPTSCLTNIQNLTVRSLVDTGSELSLLNQRVLDGLKINLYYKGEVYRYIRPMARIWT